MTATSLPGTSGNHWASTVSGKSSRSGPSRTNSAPRSLAARKCPRTGWRLAAQHVRGGSPRKRVRSELASGATNGGGGPQAPPIRSARARARGPDPERFSPSAQAPPVRMRSATSAQAPRSGAANPQTTRLRG